MIDRLQGFFGFTRTPFCRDLAPGMLHRHTAHGEAVARIGWCITEHDDGLRKCTFPFVTRVEPR